MNFRKFYWAVLLKSKYWKGFENYYLIEESDSPSMPGIVVEWNPLVARHLLKELASKEEPRAS